jgi:acetylglutamate kinase
MRSVGLRPVVVHGGGPQISDLMERLGMVPEFRDGLRVTDADSLDVARMVLVGKISRDIVSAVNVHGPLAVGLSGEDAGLIVATAPIVSTIGVDEAGQAYNINADTVAGAVAEALAAEKIIYLTDVEGLLADVGDPGSLITRTTTGQLRGLLESKQLEGGMIPKIEACVHAVEHGVGSAHILDGRMAHALLLELFTDHGIGTMIVKEGDPS